MGNDIETLLRQAWTAHRMGHVVLADPRYQSAHDEWMAEARAAIDSQISDAEIVTLQAARIRDLVSEASALRAALKEAWDMLPVLRGFNHPNSKRYDRIRDLVADTKET